MSRLTPVCFGALASLADLLNGDGRDVRLSSSSIFSISNTSKGFSEDDRSEWRVTRFCLTEKRKHTKSFRAIKLSFHYNEK